MKQKPQQHSNRTKGVVAVYGAAGHTGRFVIGELLRREMRVIAIARSEDLTSVILPEINISRRQASVNDTASLDRALYEAQAVINCAGPFIDTADAVASAALRAGIHYVDVCAEQISSSKTFETFDKPARKAGVTMVPSMAFYGGFSDLMVTAVLGTWDAVDSIEILMGIDSWHPTQGTRNTIGRNAVGNLMVTEGQLTALPSSSVEKRWNIPGPLGHQPVVEVPFSETILITRHVKTAELHNYVPRIAVDQVLNSSTPSPQATDATGRSAQRFVIEVVVSRAHESRRAIARGQDSYAVTAPLACEAVSHLLKGNMPAGVYAPGEIFDAKQFLRALEPEHLSFEIVGG